MDSTDNRIIIRCRKCNQRMFDYISGDVNVEMKCCRCKRVMVMKSLDEIPKDEDLICFLYQVVVELSENPENVRLIKSEKYKNAVKRLTAWADETVNRYFGKYQYGA